MEALNPRINALITVTAEQAVAAARASEARRARGEAGPLEGIPLAVKDLFCTEGVRTTAGSRILEGFVPPYESTVTAQLKRDGAVFLGKANLDEFAMGSSNLTSAHGGVLNPWSRRNDPQARLVPGGSSGGSAAAVAARMALGATGTDTGGSIRQPAAFCGVAGIKPTYGGARASGSSPMRPRWTRGAVCPHGGGLRPSCCGRWPGTTRRISTSADRRAGFRGRLRAVGEGAAHRRAGGIPLDGTPPEIEKLCGRARLLREAGAEIVAIRLPHTRYALPTYYTRGARPRRPRTSRAMRGAVADAVAEKSPTCATCMSAPARRASAGGAAAHHDSAPMCCRPVLHAYYLKAQECGR